MGARFTVHALWYWCYVCSLLRSVASDVFQDFQPYRILPLSVLILVLLCVTLITAMFHLGDSMPLTHLRFVVFYHCILRIDALMY